MSFSIDLKGVGEVEIQEGRFVYYSIEGESESCMYYEWKDAPDFSIKAKEIEVLVRALLQDFKEYGQLLPLVRQQVG